MAGGWPNVVVGDDDDDLLSSLQGDASAMSDAKYPKGFAGLTQTSLATLVTQAITAPLNAYMKVRRLVINAAGIVDKSFVNNISVGTISLNVGTQGAAAVAFARDAVGTSIDAVVWASPSTPPIVTIYNRTAGTIVYEGALFGPVSLTDPTK